jgi:integrase
MVPRDEEESSDVISRSTCSGSRCRTRPVGRCGLRDRMMILCMARLGLRAGEVTRLRLEDLDWRNAVVRVRARKTGHGALLPLAGEVGLRWRTTCGTAARTPGRGRSSCCTVLRVGTPINDRRRRAGRGQRVAAGGS